MDLRLITILVILGLVVLGKLVELFYLHVGPKIIRINRWHHYSPKAFINVAIIATLLLVIILGIVLVAPIMIIGILFEKVSNPGIYVTIYSILILVPGIYIYIKATGRKKLVKKIHELHGESDDENPYLFLLESTIMFRKGFISEALKWNVGKGGGKKFKLSDTGDICRFALLLFILAVSLYLVY